MGLESERLLLLRDGSDLTLVLGFWIDDEGWGGCGADFFLFGGFESFEDILPRCVDSALDGVRLRDERDGNGVFSAEGWDGTASRVPSATWGAAEGNEETVAVLPQQFPIERYEALEVDGARFEALAATQM